VVSNFVLGQKGTAPVGITAPPLVAGAPGAVQVQPAAPLPAVTVQAPPVSAPALQGAVPSHPQVPGFREWISHLGAKVNARFDRVQSYGGVQYVILRTPENREVSAKMAELSGQDVQYVQELVHNPNSAPAPTLAAPAPTLAPTVTQVALPVQEPVPPPLSQPMREWTNVQGQKLIAKFVRIDRYNSIPYVILKLENNNEYSVKISELSAVDVEYANNHNIPK
jgi:hypothetical protein